MIDAGLAKRIRLVGIDVDGVLTDGGIYLGAVDGGSMEFKRYDIHDGLGIYFLRMAGIKVAIVTGRVSESVRLRALELEADELVQDAKVLKLPAMRRIMMRHGLQPEEVAFVGDDFPDVAVLREVGLPVAVANAVDEVKAVAKVTLTRSGGRGALREFAEALLKARGDWERVWNKYVDDRTRDADATEATATEVLR